MFPIDRAPIFFLLAAVALATGCASSGDYEGTFTGRMPAAVTESYESTPGTGGAAALRDRDSARGEAKSYFVEFRARGAATYGHACVAFGQLDPNGRVPVDGQGRLIPSMTEITGLHPDNAAMVIGHFVPVPAATGPSDGDDEDAYIINRYRIDLSAAEFERAVALIKLRKDRTHVWHGLSQGCVTYVRLIAQDLGLEVPGGVHLPEGFVAKLEELNGPGAPYVLPPGGPPREMREHVPSRFPITRKPSSAPMNDSG